MIFQLCDSVLKNGTKLALLIQTLKTLQRFLGWIPAGYIFQTTLIETLADKVNPNNLNNNIIMIMITY